MSDDKREPILPMRPCPFDSAVECKLNECRDCEEHAAYVQGRPPIVGDKCEPSAEAMELIKRQTIEMAIFIGKDENLPVVNKYELAVTIDAAIHQAVEEERGKQAATYISAYALAEEIVNWSEAYPTDIFQEPTPEQIDVICRQSGFSLTNIAAMVLRRFTKPWGDMARAVLQRKEGGIE